MFCNNSLHPCYKRSFHNQPSVAFAAESERLGGTCASLLENVRINRCSRYLNAYAVKRAMTSIVWSLCRICGGLRPRGPIERQASAAAEGMLAILPVHRP
ncbi:protein of unknown function [Bradyrhizobium vignae]|uniref:Uncharacterized protein n=1 Tax=Bradyrhizobium vignae TaxID=1549949 RepID=A0A2U3QC13_9BRAD|nr:protein of unknown function [Bradyrhizobium vignae]